MNEYDYESWTDEYFREYDIPEDDDYEWATVVCPQCESMDVVRHEDHFHDWECIECGFWFD